MKKQITIAISPEGLINAKISGFRGKKCLDYISIIEQLLDAETVDSQTTDEYYLEETVEQKHTTVTQSSVLLNQEK